MYNLIYVLNTTFSSFFRQAKQVLPTWLAKKSLLKNIGLNTHAPLNQPLLTANEIGLLADELAILTQCLSLSLKPSVALHQGKQPSHFMGAGLEYEESRPYVLGDDIRRINWQLMVKTGKAYTKLFQEEHQEHWFILVDHRQSMRFGTRVRLKATQATRVAGYFAWLAQKSEVSVVGARLAESLALTPSYEGKGCYANLMEKFSIACPPLQLTKSITTEPHINDVLLRLSQQMQPGSRLIMISDFHDVDAKTTEILTALQQIAMVQMVAIEDRVESVLPEVEGLQLQCVNSEQIISIDSVSQRANYQVWSKQYHQNLQDYLQRAGVGFHHLWADDTLSAYKYK